MVRTGLWPVRTFLYIPYKKDFVSLQTEMKDANSIIFIDTEFTSTTSEILELCVVNGAGEVVYHNLFKPVRAKYWRKFPHNITKTRVRNCRSFSRCLKDIQPLFDNAELVCGFAVDNDFRHLSEGGLRIDPAKAMEVRYLYWALHHDTPHVANPFNIPGLSACATEMCPGLELNAEHSAKGDTLTTFHLFCALKEALPKYDWSDTTRAWQACFEDYREGVAEYYRKRAHGYVVFHPVEGGYMMTMTQELGAEDEGCIIVEVADRQQALGHFRDRFSRRLHHNEEPYALTDTDIDYIRNYTNVFDPAEWKGYKKLMEGLHLPAEVETPAPETKDASTRLKSKGKPEPKGRGQKKHVKKQRKCNGRKQIKRLEDTKE